jgi:hypothetical protein
MGPRDTERLSGAPTQVFKGDLVVQKLFDFTHFLQNLGKVAPSTGRGLDPQFLQPVHQLLFCHRRYLSTPCKLHVNLRGERHDATNTGKEEG